MTWDFAGGTASEGDSRHKNSLFSGLSSESSSCLAVENQQGQSLGSTSIKAQLVSFEIVQPQPTDSNPSYESVKELTYQVQPAKLAFAHGELDLLPQELVAGGIISKAGAKIDIAFSKEEKVHIDTTSGDVRIEGGSHYQMDVFYKGTPWQRTYLTSDQDTQIVFGQGNLNSIQRGPLMEVFPQSPSKYTGSEPIDAASEVAAENRIRSALKKVREEFGVGTPETKVFAQSLEKFLKSTHDSAHDEEIERLDFEVKRAGLMKTVLESIECDPEADSTKMAPETARQLRAALISIHIAGGDKALEKFVGEINRRLNERVLVAPNDNPGLLRHGALVWTPEGVTRYTGSFEIKQK